jgi:phosphoglycerol transferase MdoB-like AlkP superfamily enzyme
MHQVKLLLKRIGLLCLIYSVSRALFLVFNFQSYNQVPVSELLMAFAVGLRFDIAAICRVNSVFILLSMLPVSFFVKAWYQRVLKVVFLLSNVPFLIVNVVDYEYFKFIGQRSTLSLLDMGTDIPDQIGQLSFHYWYLVAPGTLLIFLVYYFLPGRSMVPANTQAATPLGTRVRDFLIMVVVVALAVLGGRGGWQERSLATGLAEVNDKENLGQLALNSTYTIINSPRKCDTATFAKLDFFATDEELKKEFPQKNISARPGNQRFDNVVIIIVESLSADYTGLGNPRHGYTPFLDGLAERGIYFENSFADGRRSIDASPSILAGLPHLRDETFYCTQFKHLHGLGSLLKEQGYNTSFFHGGKNGTMSFDVFSRRMGFDDYYGLNEYPRPEDSDGIWGIYDEPYLQYFAQQLSARRQPFASVVFTLSTHNPYKIPPQHEGKFPEGELPIHRTVAYFDYALKKFFETAEKMPWYQNTLFIITGDHIGPKRAVPPRMIDGYRVPIVFFHPGGQLPKVDHSRITQHVDIGPSVLQFLGIATEQTLPFGHSIFDPSYDGLAMGQMGGNYWIADKNYYLEYRFKGPSKLFALAQLDAPITDKPEVKERLEKKLKAQIQWFYNGLAKDNLYQ